jgi:AmmeMemoRadiSam system protein B/AmmeMemoRadiSam system protein A
MATYPAFGPAAWRIALFGLLISAIGCGARPETARDAQTNQPADRSVPAGAPQRVREPAVAGLFYPGDEKTLRRTVDGLLAEAPEHPIQRLRGLICPHAGYAFSGKTAAIGYKTLAGRQVETVIVLGPTHYAFLRGASIPDAQGYRTPLGLAPISEKAATLLASEPFLLEPRCEVERPAWWRRGPKTAPPEGQDTAETWEHSVEVQVPFLQRQLGTFKLLPVLLGEVDPEAVAKAIAGILDDKTVVVASSDLSHYYKYDVAKGLDGRCVRAICDMNIDDMKSQEACGKTPILSLMHLAKLKGWKAELLDARNSGDVTGDKDRVVGYASVAFYEPAPESFSEPERKSLLEWARRVLVSAAADPNSALAEVVATELPAKFREKKACFVTLTKDGELRGCIGHLEPQEALYLAVRDNARNAALRDPRFPEVKPDEVPKIKIEISVLTEPKPLSFESPEDLLRKLQPHMDGVVLRIGMHRATFLPQVWAQLPDKVEFLNRLSQKAGCESSAWRGKDTGVSIYHVECFEEH